jgi:hypothetical protein
LLFFSGMVRLIIRHFPVIAKLRSWPRQRDLIWQLLLTTGLNYVNFLSSMAP